MRKLPRATAPVADERTERMKWQCWDCSPDDGCELADLAGGDITTLAHKPHICPFDGSECRFEIVPDEPAPDKQG